MVAERHAALRAWHALRHGPASEASGSSAADRRRLVAHDLLATARLRRVIEALHDTGIVVAVLKGAALGALYPEPWMRPRHDDDLLVRPADFERAGDTLLRLGYVRQPQSPGPEVTGQAHYRHQSRLGTHHVDLHWRLLVPPAFWQLPEADALLGRSVPMMGLGPWARALAPADALLHVAAHEAAHHGGPARLDWLLDLHLLASRLTPDDWREVPASARQSRVCRVLAAGLAAAHQALGTPLPGGVLEDLDRVPAEPSARHLRSAGRLHGWWLEMRASPDGPWAAFRARAFPSPDYIMARYGVPRGVVPLAYGWRLGAGGLAWILEAVRRRGR